MDLIVYSSGEVNQSPDIDHKILKDYPSAFGGRGGERRDPATAWTRPRVLRGLAYRMEMNLFSEGHPDTSKSSSLVNSFISWGR